MHPRTGNRRSGRLILGGHGSTSEWSRQVVRRVIVFRAQNIRFLSIGAACPYGGKSNTKGGKHEVYEYDLVQGHHADVAIDTGELDNGKYGRHDEVCERDSEEDAHALGR